MNKALIMNIQKSCFHDGPGIRTTVFFKGCPLSCIWCHNPESQRFTKEIMFNKEKCTGCGQCESRCQKGNIDLEAKRFIPEPKDCEFCENCIDFCVKNAREIVGKTVGVDELLKEVEKDRVFYDESGGGVTLSGGEVMCQIDFVESFVKKAKQRGLSVVIDTCGHAPFENFERIIPYVDLFLYDIKLINSRKHEEYTGLANDIILQNLKELKSSGANVAIRIPLIDGINTSDSDIEEMIGYIGGLDGEKKINLLPYHNKGTHKYEKINMKNSSLLMGTPSQEKLEEIRSRFAQNKFDVQIGG